MESRIMHMCSRAALDIEGVGEEMSGAIAAEMGMRDIDDPLDLFRWEVGDLAEMTWTTASGSTMTFGMARAKKAKDALERAKTLPLNRWLVALGIHTVGVNTSKEISRLAKDVQELRILALGMLARIADGEDKNSERLAPWKVSHHLGPVSCKNLRDFLATDAGVSATNRLERLGVKSDNYDPLPSAPAEGPLTGKSFCVTGTLSVPRDAIHELIKENGGNVVTGVSAKTDCLVAGDKAGSKIQKAEKLGVKVLSESELREMI
jgi:DNA ligase (NAD+)